MTKQPVPVAALIDLGIEPYEFTQMRQLSSIPYVEQLQIIRAGRSVTPLLEFAASTARRRSVTE